MLFNSLEFWVFFAAVFSVYLSIPHRVQNLWLLAASYLFYGAWDWRFLGLILLSTGVDYAVGLGLGRTQVARSRRGLVLLSLVTNLGILGTFKYLGFFVESTADLLHWFGLSPNLPVLHVVLPVGISFYTFQTLSYTIDVYRGRLEPTRDLADFALFVAFFPQLVAGPIERAGRLLPQIRRPRVVTLERLQSGGWLVLWGLFKKVVVGDNLAFLVDAVYTPGGSPGGAEVLLATYAFAFQIYCDFSGYSNIARGLARMLGFDLMTNFALPYFAATPSEFWRRWHISLSTWLRDYLYIPLGGNRGGRFATYRNLLLTMLLGGLWHGAAWTFVAWGAFHGVLLGVYRVGARWWRLSVVGWRRVLVRGGAVIVMFHLVCLGWLLFRAEGMAQASSLLATLFAGPWNWDAAAGFALPLCVLIAPLLAIQIAQARSADLEVVLRWPLPARVLVYAFLVLAIAAVGEDFGQPFIYFQF